MKASINDPAKSLLVNAPAAATMNMPVSSWQWTLLSEPPDTWVGIDDPLPSDSRFRADLQALLCGDLKTAQMQKELMEKRQRQDKKAREGRGDST
eukprot:scaffold35068_cov23-Tisochrysis_lutea.AAC.3